MKTMSTFSEKREIPLKNFGPRGAALGHNGVGTFRAGVEDDADREVLLRVECGIA